MAQVRIRNREDLEKWLKDQPREVAVAIAARAAMRTLPMLEKWLATDEEKAVVGVFLVFRALAVSQLAATGSAPHAETRQVTGHALNSILFHAASFSDILDVEISASSVFSNLLAIDDTVLAAAQAADVVTDTSRLIVGAAWESVESDANFLTEGEEKSISDFLCEPLWPSSMPEELHNLWVSMRECLLAREGEHWEVWTNWYDARLDPSRRIPCYSPPIPELERKRVLLPEEVWKAGPAWANAKIRWLIEESGCARSEDDDPLLPDELPGVRFSMDEAGRLHVVPSLPDEEEANDPVQQRMFARLKQKMAQLMSHMGAIGNQYPELANVLRDYDEEVSVASLTEIDIPMVWMTGLGVVEQAEAFRKTDEHALTPRLEPEVEGLLQEVAGLHGAFITGFRKGRELIARRMQGQFGPEAVERLQEAQLQFLDFASRLDVSALTGRARAVFGKARDILLLRSMQAEDKIGATLHVSVNALIALGKGLSPFLPILPAAMGPEGVQAWLQFLQTHGGIIAAIAQTSPELRAYLRHLFDKAGIPWPDPDDDPQAG